MTARKKFAAVNRNAAAHNSCLLNSLKKPYGVAISTNRRIMHFISQIKGIGRQTRRNKMSNPAIHDFVVILYVFNNAVTSEKTKEATMKKLKQLTDNMLIGGGDTLKGNQIILSHYEFIKKIFDYFNKPYI